MATYKTPDVYVEEISLFPPSVAEVESAVPAFIGHTERATFKGQDLTKKPTRIKSLVEYEERFGKGPPVKVNEVLLDPLNNVASASFLSTYLLYDSIRLFFANGGGKCYIVSVGGYGDSLVKDKFAAGLDTLRREDEPTMLLFPDAITFPAASDLYALQQAALKQAGELMDRFVIMDLAPSVDPSTWVTSYESFRNEIGLDSLKYGAAYTPYLKTRLSKDISFRTIHDKLKRSSVSIQFENLTTDSDTLARIGRLRIAMSNSDLVSSNLAAFLTSHNSGSSTPTSLSEAFQRYYAAYTQAIQAIPAEAATDATSVAAARNALVVLLDFAFDLGGDHVNSLLEGASQLTQPSGNGQSALKDVENLTRASLAGLFARLVAYNLGAGPTRLGAPIENGWQDSTTGASRLTAATWGRDFDAVPPDTSAAVYPTPGSTTPELLANFKAAGEQISTTVREIISAVDGIPNIMRQHETVSENSLRDGFAVYKDIVDSVAREATVLPPSGAIAGVYAKIDRQRGCWKAPANVSLAEVVGFTVQIDNKDQEDLNVDVVAGKSINALRTFTGKGHLVWGARTLAGNDNEWRYIPVRRFFSVVEESIKKSTYWAVFEPNDANLWVKVKGMIENYLILKWRDGALQGAKPEHAFFVKVGLNQTMTAIDILEGRLIVEIGMAVVRPAEFIILRFMHKMPQS